MGAGKTAKKPRYRKKGTSTGSADGWFRTVAALQWPDGRERVLYQLQPRQNEAYRLTPLDRAPDEDYPRHIGYGGAAGGGKSHLARAVATVAALKWPGSTGIIFRRTKGEVKENHVFKYFQEVPRSLPDGTKIYTWNGEDMCVTYEHPDESKQSRIYFGFLKEFEDVFKYQGPEYDYMIFEEATHYRWEAVRWLTGNRLRATQSYCRPFVLYPSNPGNVGHHWYKRLFITKSYDSSLQEDPANYAFVQAKVEDNAVLMDRDPEYLKELATLPEPYRSWLMNGDWDAGLGLALPMLDPDTHYVDSFVPPDHWTLFGAFDWGYEHPWCFGWYTVDEDGRVYKGDTFKGRHMQVPDIIDTIKARLDNALGENGWHRLRYIEAGHDCWADIRSRQENVPVIAETFQAAGLALRQANISRIAGLNNLRLHLHVPDGSDGPRLKFMRTDGNFDCFYCLESMPVDPDRPEDALKSSADQFGRGGDDEYDECRMAIASRPRPSPSRFLDTPLDAWSPEVLQAEADRQRRGRAPREREAPLHPEFGRMV